MMITLGRKLLVLDMDETLIHATTAPIGRAADFRVGPYSVYIRPNLDVFLLRALELFRVGIWTASSEDYARPIVERLAPSGNLEFVWCRDRCTFVHDSSSGEVAPLKNLKKLKARGHSLSSIIAVDDQPSNFRRNYGNVVAVEEFTGSEGDDELPLLIRYLEAISKVPDVRAVEKRRWREGLDRHR